MRKRPSLVTDTCFALVETDSYAITGYAQLKYLVASVLHDPRTGRVAVFALNRSPVETMELAVELRDLGDRKLSYASELHHTDLKATNTRSAPQTVQPSTHQAASLEGARLRASLRPLSWNVFVTEAS